MATTEELFAADWAYVISRLPQGNQLECKPEYDQRYVIAKYRYPQLSGMCHKNIYFYRNGQPRPEEERRVILANLILYRRDAHTSGANLLDLLIMSGLGYTAVQMVIHWGCPRSDGFRMAVVGFSLMVGIYTFFRAISSYHTIADCQLAQLISPAAVSQIIRDSPDPWLGRFSLQPNNGHRLKCLSDQFRGSSE